MDVSFDSRLPLSVDGQFGVHSRTLAWKLIAGRLDPAEEFPT
jgi:hypothetical protein